MKILVVALIALFSQTSNANFIRHYTCQLGTDARSPRALLAVQAAHPVKGRVVSASVVDVKRPAKQGRPPSYGGLKAKECKKADSNDFTCTWTASKEMKETFKVDSYRLNVRLNLGGGAMDATFTTKMLTVGIPRPVTLPCELNGR